MKANMFFDKRLCILEETTIFEAIQVLNQVSKRIVIVVTEDFKLLGILIDMDIRRIILNKIPLDSPVNKVMNQNPHIVSPQTSESEMLNLITMFGCHQLPVVNDQGVVVDLITSNQLMQPNPISNQVIIMAGGLGTRLHPITHTIPKPLIEIAGTPILFILLDQLLKSGFGDFTLTLNYKSERIRKAVKSKPTLKSKVDYIVEPKRLGTAGSLGLLKKKPTDSFFVMNADILTNIDYTAMLDFHNRNESDITLAIRKEEQEIPYGVIDVLDFQVLNIREKPSYTYFSNVGIYIIHPKVLNLIKKNEYLDMPTLINLAIENGFNVKNFPIHEYWIDIGNPNQLARAQKDYPIYFEQKQFVDYENSGYRRSCR